MINSIQPGLFEPTVAESASRVWLGLQIDHRQFLDASQEEWLNPPASQEGWYIAINAYTEVISQSEATNNNVITLSLQIDTELLSEYSVLDVGVGTWKEATADSLNNKTDFVFWRGALPLFSVTKITFQSVEEKTRFIGLSRNASNVSLPDAEFIVGAVKTARFCEVKAPILNVSSIVFPSEYGQFRGAMTMAVWAVPRVDPWLDILIASLTANTASLKLVARDYNMPWLFEFPWLQNSSELSNSYIGSSGFLVGKIS